MQNRNSASHAKVSPYPPSRNRHCGPGDQRYRKSERDISLNEPRKADSKREQTKASERSASRIDGGRLSAAALPFKASFALATDLVSFNQRDAGAKNCRKRQKQAAHRLSEMASDRRSENGCSAAQHESQNILVPDR